MALKCTKTSPPSSFSIKPNHFFSLNHFTLPSAKSVRPPFLRFVEAGFTTWRHKKTTPLQERALKRWWLDCSARYEHPTFPCPALHHYLIKPNVRAISRADVCA